MTEECNFHLRRIGPKPSNSRVPNTMRLKLGITGFGRGQNNDFFLDSQKLKNFISRQHAEIHGTRNENGDVEFTMFDRGLNGTFINDIKVNKTSVLEMGDKITFGHTNGYKLSPGQYASQPTSEFQFILEEAQKSYSCLSAGIVENSVSDKSSQDLLERLIDSQKNTTLLNPWSSQVNGQTVNADDRVANSNSTSKIDQQYKEKINAKGDNSSNVRTADSCGVIKKGQLCGEQIIQQDFLYQEKNMSQRNGCTYKQLENRDSLSPAKKSTRSPKKRGGKCKTDHGKPPDTLAPEFTSDHDTNFQVICDEDTSTSMSEKNTPNSDLLETLPYGSSTPSKSPLKIDITTPTDVVSNIATDTSLNEESELSDSEQVTPESDKKALSFARKIFPDEIKSNKYRNVKNVQRSVEHMRTKKNEYSPKKKVGEIASKKVSDDPYLFSEEDSSSDGESKRKNPRLASKTSMKTGGEASPASNKRKFSSQPKATHSRAKKPMMKKQSKSEEGLEEGVEWYEEELCDALDCKRPRSKRVQWVQCDDCDKWYHTACVHCSYDRVKDFDIGFNCGCT